MNQGYTLIFIFYEYPIALRFFATFNYILEEGNCMVIKIILSEIGFLTVLLDKQKIELGKRKENLIS